ncbi:rho GTPase-activating protein 6 isoform X2 [Erpetoichthys calabaricus]|uniref:rho GTPase-activating protein 6 isoform X2 n=1 Tax=Erpetoichthys calabaricus TaxID=27687 RepID=UPI0022343679|nr:rho GTPase-activating protein 6 isoform X2 [Erpetoichthys calabaricus]
MSQGLLNTVFSCSSPASKTISKRRLRQTRSLDPAIIRNYGTDTEYSPAEADSLRLSCPLDVPGALTPPASVENVCAPKVEVRSRSLKFKQNTSSFSSPCTPAETSPSSNFQFDYDFKGSKRNTAWDLPFLAKIPPSTPPGSVGTIFSPRKWLQKKLQQTSSQSYIVWKSEGDFTWNSMSGRNVRLKPVPIQSLSELERVRLQDVAFNRLQQDYDLGCQITIPKDGQKRKKSLRRKLDSLAKEKNKDKEFVPQAFGMPLSQVITNDRTYKQRQDSQKDDQKESPDLVTSLLQFGMKRQNKELSSSNSSLSSTSETPNESTSPNTPEAAPRVRRRGGMSVDSITDLDDNQSRLLEALQLSLPAEAQNKKEKQRDKKLSLNPIYRQVPRLVDSCCQHIEKYGLQTVGIFRVGSSKKRVRQLREEFDRGVDVVLDEEHSVHDVAALLKEFLRDIPDPLLTRELYTAFINTLLLESEDQTSALQLLIYLLPPCNCDTLHRLLLFLSTVAGHAEDTMDKEGQEVTGNKMTSLNLATIFGPNLLHKQKSTDKEFSVQSTARAEESAAIITVVQRMIETYEALFMVPPDLQNEVLMSLLETDPDVVDYLLRRKASQSTSPDPMRRDGSFSLGERHSSTDSNKASSGEVSPYDNNSPVLAERLLFQRQDDIAPESEKLFRVPEQYALVGHLKSRPREQLAGQLSGKGSYGNMHEYTSVPEDTSLSLGSLTSEWLESQGLLTLPLGNGKSPVRRTQTTAGFPDCKPHSPVNRASSSPQEESCRHIQLSLDSLCSRPEDQSASSSAEDLSHRSLNSACLKCSTKSTFSSQGHVGGNESRPPPPYPGTSHQRSSGNQALTSVSNILKKNSKPEKSTTVLSEPKAVSADQKGHKLDPQLPISRNQMNKMYFNQAENPSSRNIGEQDWQEWQRERWQIWELLSADNADSLPETLV